MIPTASDFINKTTDDEPVITALFSNCSLFAFDDGSCALVNLASDQTSVLSLAETITLVSRTQHSDNLSEHDSNELDSIICSLHELYKALTETNQPFVNTSGTKR